LHKRKADTVLPTFNLPEKSPKVWVSLDIYGYYLSTEKGETPCKSRRFEIQENKWTAPLSEKPSSDKRKRDFPQPVEGFDTLHQVIQQLYGQGGAK
jgi:hypothetical protein